MNLTEEEAILFNPKRFAIVTVLYLRGPQTMAELKKAVGLTWGDLDSNLRYLARNKLVEIRKTIIRAGPRTIIKLTSKGEESYKSLVEKLKKSKTYKVREKKEVKSYTYK